jgi:Rrf2 family protein
MLSTTSQHAIRALVHLSRVPEGGLILGRELAELAGIPANFLAKIMLALRNAGLVDATRGQGGGYRLLQSANQIALMQVVELFEGVNATPGCFLGEKHACRDEEACPAHSGWKVVCEAYFQFMTKTTIAQIGRQSDCTSVAPSTLHSLSM